MRKLIAVLLLLVAVPLFAKSKEKRFEPVSAQPAAAAGSYRGPSESYGLVLEVSADGTLRGNYVEMGRVAVLHAIELRGDRFTARASFDDGSVRVITGSFAKRILNGTTAFGLRVHEVPVEGLGAIDTFFEKL